jgi:hypothetical protein
MFAVPRRRRAYALGAVVALAVAGAAFAYWTTTGSGTGSAAVGSSAAVTAVQTSTLTAMYPGDSAQTLSGDFDNPSSGAQYVTSVTVSISGVTKASGAAAGTCDATDFTLANAAMSVDAEVPSGTGTGAWSGATIHFNDKSSTNQDACKGATVNLAFVVA